MRKRQHRGSNMQAPRYEPGWTGGFTRHQTPGAIANGTTIFKVNSDPEDANPDGAVGVVLGSISDPEVHGGQLFYFVEWMATPRVAVGCIGWKLSTQPPSAQGSHHERSAV